MQQNPEQILFSLSRSGRTKKQQNPEIPKPIPKIPLERPEEDGFSLELSKLSLHDEILNRVACKLGVHDPTKIRITPHRHHTQEPKPTRITYTSKHHLSDILIGRNQEQTCNILNYEVLEPKAGPSTSANQTIIPSSCAICLDSPLEGACIPCGHMAGCMSCLNDIKKIKSGVARFVVPRYNRL